MDILLCLFSTAMGPGSCRYLVNPHCRQWGGDPSSVALLTLAPPRKSWPLLPSAARKGNPHNQYPGPCVHLLMQENKSFIMREFFISRELDFVCHWDLDESHGVKDIFWTSSAWLYFSELTKVWAAVFKKKKLIECHRSPSHRPALK